MLDRHTVEERQQSNNPRKHQYRIARKQEFGIATKYENGIATKQEKVITIQHINRKAGHYISNYKTTKWFQR